MAELTLEQQRAVAIARARRRRAAEAEDDRGVVERVTDFVEEHAPGFERGFQSGLYEGPLRFIGEAAEAVLPEGAVKRYYKGLTEDVKAKTAEAEAAYVPPEGFDYGRVSGEIVGSTALAGPAAGVATGVTKAALPTAGKLIPNIVGGVAGGTTAGAVAPVRDPTGDYWSQKEQDVKTGAVTGAVVPTALHGAARTIAPVTNRAVQTMRRMGVTPTIGQQLGASQSHPMLGRFAADTEEKLMSAPLLGDVIRGARTAAFKQFNRGTFNDVLAPINKKLPRYIRQGHSREALEFADEAISGAYDDVLSRVAPRVDRQFAADLANLQSRANLELPFNEAQRFNKVMTDFLRRYMVGQRQMTGQAWKELDSKLGQWAAKYRNDPSTDLRDLGKMFGASQKALRDMLGRSAPKSDRAAVDAANQAFSRKLRVEDAMSRLNAQTGEMFTPSQLAAASKKFDTSLRKGDTARGRAVMQDVAEAGQDVLKGRVPDSGTAGRISLMALGAGAVGGLIDPRVWLGLAPTAAYVPGVRGAISSYLSGGMGVRQPVAEALRGIAPYAAAPYAIATREDENE